jgi:regulatory protein
MSKITRLVKAKTREKRVNIYLDGKYSLTLLAEVVLKERLRVGQELSDDEITNLAGKDSYQRSLNTAVRLLGYRPRSEAEIAQRLRRNGFDDACSAKALNYLKDRGLVDDNAFARFWIENRESFSPRSRRMTGMELRRKGLSRDIIEQVIGQIDEGESAYRAALKKARLLSTADYPDFRKRLGAYLGRRGFGYEVINDTIKKIWQDSVNPGQSSHSQSESGIKQESI